MPTTTGTIKRLVHDKGFGFIAASDGNEYFFHQSSCQTPFNELREGQSVTFDKVKVRRDRAARTSGWRRTAISRFAAAAAFITLLLAGLLARPAATQSAGASPSPTGAALFSASCASCHSGDDARAPAPEVLRGRSPQAILDALTAGSMKYQGLALSGDERRAIAEYLTGRKLRAPLSGNTIGNCGASAGAARRIRAPARRGTAGDRRSRTRTSSRPSRRGLTAEQVPRLHLKWAFGFPDATSAWAQPTIAGGRLFVGSQNGTVYSLDAASGCVVWTFAAQGGVRASISIGRRAGTGPARRARPARGLRRVLLRSEGVRLRGRRGDRPACCGAEGRRASAGAADRLADALRGSSLRADLVVRRRRQAARLRLLHVPRQHRRARRARPATSSGRATRSPRSRGCCAPTPTAPSCADRRAARSGRRRRSTSSAARSTSASATPTAARAQPTTDAVLAFDLKTGAMRWARQMAPSTPDVFGCTPGDVNCGERAGPDFDFGASPVLADARRRTRS